MCLKVPRFAIVDQALTNKQLTLPARAMPPTVPLNTDLLEHAIARLELALQPRERPVPEFADLNLPSALPETGSGKRAALDTLADEVLERCAQLAHKGYFAHMDPPTPDITWATSIWQSATNQNMLHPDAAPAARALERYVVQWLAPFFGMDAGHIVPGATISNFTALWVARDLKGVTRVVASDRAHLSIKKSAHLLGLNFESIHSNSAHQMCIDQLGDLSTTAVVLTAGTVATGAIDPVAELAGNILSAAAWRHVDAAWAGPVRLTHTHQRLLDGIEHADSVGFSAHKWLYQPKGAALVLFKDYQQALPHLSYGGGYLAEPNIGLLGSAPASALPLAATLLSMGRSGIAASIDADMLNAGNFASLISNDDRFKLWQSPTCGVVVFRARGIDSRELRARLTDAWLSVVDMDGEVWLRAVAANPNADIHHVYQQLVRAL